MNENQIVTSAAETNVSAANDSNYAPSSYNVLENLTSFYENHSDEGNRADTETASTKEETTTENAEIAPESAEEIENPGENSEGENSEGENSKEGEQKPEAEPNESEELGESDFDGLKASPAAKEFPDLDALKAQFPRQSKELLARAAELSAEAKKGYERIESLGGEANIEPLARISTGIRDGDSVAAFTGITEIGSKDALLKFVSDTLHLGIVHSQRMQDNPEFADFGKELQSVADQIISQRFGEDCDLETIQKLNEFNKAGWMEKIEEWKETGYVDEDEWQEQLAADNDPGQFQSLKSQLKAANEQLEQARQQTEKSAETATDSQNAEFINSANEHIERSLNEVVWKKSALRDLTTDSAEMKSQKAFLRDTLASEAKNAFGALPEIGKLKTAFKNGASSKAYQDSLSGAIEQAALRIRENNSVAESIVARLYDKTRNGSLAQKSAADKATEGRPPAAPTQTIAPAPTKPKTSEEILKDFEDFYSRHG